MSAFELESAKPKETQPTPGGKDNVEHTDLNLHDTSVKDSGTTSEEEAAVEECTTSVFMAVEEIQKDLEDLSRVSAAVEALRMVPTAELNSAVIRMFETHLPSGTKRVSTESALTPTKMRSVAVESGKGFFAKVGERIMKMLRWIRDRLASFVSLFTGKSKKASDQMQEAEKKIADTKKDNLPVVNAADVAKAEKGETIQAKDGTEVKVVYGVPVLVNNNVGYIVTPTEHSGVFGDSLEASDVLAALKEYDTYFTRAQKLFSFMEKYAKDPVGTLDGYESPSAFGDAMITNSGFEQEEDGSVGFVWMSPDKYRARMGIAATEGGEFTAHQKEVQKPEQRNAVWTREDAKNIGNAIRHSNEVIEKLNMIADGVVKQFEKSFGAMIKDVESKEDAMNAILINEIKKSATASITLINLTLNNVTTHPMAAAGALIEIATSIARASSTGVADKKDPAQLPGQQKQIGNESAFAFV